MGDEEWEALPRWQQNALMSMGQGVYTPSVGKLSYNLYALPEINNMALAFVAGQAAEAAVDPGVLGPAQSALWRPKDHEVLWGGAGYQLAVMNEIWPRVNGEPIPAVHVSATPPFAGDVVRLNRLRLDLPETPAP